MDGNFKGIVATPFLVNNMLMVLGCFKTNNHVNELTEIKYFVKTQGDLPAVNTAFSIEYPPKIHYLSDDD